MPSPITIWLAHWPALDDPAPFTIAARVGGGPVVEFRGPPYEMGGWYGSEAQKLHDALAGFHSCILHADGGPFVVHDAHPDYPAVRALLDSAP